jgi:hypothetical protein
MRSRSATEVPPNFITKRDTCLSPRKPVNSCAEAGASPPPAQAAAF